MTAKSTRYVVIYKDRARAPLKYFGPFVSFPIADRFREDLPEPQEGGLKVSRMLEMFGVNDESIARDLILLEREQHAH